MCGTIEEDALLHGYQVRQRRGVSSVRGASGRRGGSVLTRGRVVRRLAVALVVPHRAERIRPEIGKGKDKGFK